MPDDHHPSIHRCPQCGAAMRPVWIGELKDKFLECEHCRSRVDVPVVVRGRPAGVLLLATPIAVQALVNFVALGGAIQQLVVVALFLFLGLGFAGVMSALQNWVVEILQRRIFVRLVAELSWRLPRIRQKAYDEGYGPELVNRFFDVMTLQKATATLLLDVTRLKEALTDRTRCVLPVHLYGQCADMDPILEIGDIVKVKVLEVDKQGRIRLSMKAVAEDEAKAAE